MAAAGATAAGVTAGTTIDASSNLKASASCSTISSPVAEFVGPKPERGPVVETLVLQPTAFCNIDCKYCYLPSRDQRGVMEQSTVRRIFERVFESGYAAPAISVIWHAGEPLAAGLAFYQEAFASVEAMSPAEY